MTELKALPALALLFRAGDGGMTPRTFRDYARKVQVEAAYNHSHRTQNQFTVSCCLT